MTQPTTCPVTVDRHRDLGDGGTAGDVGELELVVGFLDVAVQGAVGSEHDGPCPLVLVRPHFAYKHETS